MQNDPVSAVERCAAYLRKLEDDPGFREKIVRAGQEQIRERLSTGECAARIGQRLGEILRETEKR